MQDAGEGRVEKKEWKLALACGLKLYSNIHMLPPTIIGAVSLLLCTVCGRYVCMYVPYIFLCILVFLRMHSYLCERSLFSGLDEAGFCSFVDQIGHHCKRTPTQSHSRICCGEAHRNRAKRLTFSCVHI